MPTSPSDAAATAASNAETAGAFFADTAKQTSEQIIEAVRQSTKLGFDTASAWIDTLSAVLPAAPAGPFAPSQAALQQWVATSFEAAENVLALQRELATELVAKLVPAGK